MHLFDHVWLIALLALTALVLFWLVVRPARRTPPAGGNGNGSGHDAVSDLSPPPPDRIPPRHLDLTHA